MTIRYLTIMAMAVLALGISGCKDKTKSETTEKSVVNGTTVENKTSTETTVDDNGDTTRDVESKTTVDPEGLMNKRTTEEESHTEEHH